MGGREEYLSLIDGGAAGRGVGQLGPEAIRGRHLKEPISGPVAEGGPARTSSSLAPMRPSGLPPSFPLFAQGDNGGGNGSNAANTSVV